jgi:hypothetical protein
VALGLEVVAARQACMNNVMAIARDFVIDDAPRYAALVLDTAYGLTAAQFCVARRPHDKIVFTAAPQPHQMVCISCSGCSGTRPPFFDLVSMSSLQEPFALIGRGLCYVVLPCDSVLWRIAIRASVGA